MFSNQGARKSVDSLSPTVQTGPRDFPFHGYEQNPDLSVNCGLPIANTLKKS